MTKVRIASRASPLAIAQAEFVQSLLLNNCGISDVEIKTYTTSGDKFLDKPLVAYGGKALFTKEIEEAVLAQEADLAVHCAKDVPTEMPPGLSVAAVLESGDPRDGFLSTRYDALEELPKGARVGTASLRRQAYIQKKHPDLQVDLLRGNVNTRLKKLAQEFDGTIMACVGLERLNMQHEIKQTMDPTQWIPAIGQGILCLQVRSNDQVLKKQVACLNHQETQDRWALERCFMETLGASCRMPIAAFADFHRKEGIQFYGMFGDAETLAYVQDQFHIPAHAALTEAFNSVQAFALQLKEKLQGA